MEIDESDTIVDTNDINVLNGTFIVSPSLCCTTCLLLNQLKLIRLDKSE